MPRALRSRIVGGKPKQTAATSIKLVQTENASPSTYPLDGDQKPAHGLLRTAFYRIGPRAFAGHVVDPQNLTRRPIVQLMIDGASTQLATAHEYDHALAQEGIGDGCYGFSFLIADDVLIDSAIVAAYLANTDIAVGTPIVLRETPVTGKATAGFHGVRWVGGLRFFGPLHEAPEGLGRITAVIDGAPVAEATSNSLQHIGSGVENTRAVPAFDLHLPERFADGRVRTVRFLDESGSDVPGSPLTFVAFDQGLERTLAKLGHIDSERLRGQMFDLLVPNSVPLSTYDEWAKRFPAPTTGKPKTAGSVAVVFVGDDEKGDASQDLKCQTYADWIAAALPSVDSPTAFNPDQLEEFLQGDAAECQTIVFAVSGLRLAPDAIERFISAFEAFPNADAAYGDLAVRGGDERRWPLALPAFDYERMLEQGYCSFLFAMRREQALMALVAGASSMHRMFNSLIDEPSAAGSRIVHLPGVTGTLPDFDRTADAGALAIATAEHLRQRGVDADIMPAKSKTFPAIRIQRRSEQGAISIIIPTRDRVGLLRQCLTTIRPAVTRARAEVLIVDNDSADPEMLSYLAAIDGKSAKVIRSPGAFNFSRLNNVAAASAKGEYLCLLNNDIKAIDDRWLGEMLSRIHEPDVGVVGATLIWPSGVVQHAGVTMGTNFGAAHAFNDRMQDDPGYADMLTAARECSAVTAACLLTRKEDYVAVGGLDEIYFPVNFNDVDYCLKLRARGKRVVVTPYARLLHLESASRGSDVRSDRAARLQRELRALRARWLETLVDDPYYNPMLALDPIPFSALAWPPRTMTPRTNRPQRPVMIPPGM